VGHKGVAVHDTKTAAVARGPIHTRDGCGPHPHHGITKAGRETLPGIAYVVTLDDESSVQRFAKEARTQESRRPCGRIEKRRFD